MGMIFFKAVHEQHTLNTFLSLSRPKNRGDAMTLDLAQVYTFGGS